MKKRYLALAGVAVIGVFIVPPLLSASNELVKVDQRVERSVGEWQSQIQRRYDLLPNIARTAEASGTMEKGIQSAVAEARSSMPAILKKDPTEIANNPELQKQLIEAQAQSSAALTKVNAAVEQTVNVKSVDLYHDVMKSIEGSENRIQTARRDAIIAINDYNTYIRTFPASVPATILGYHKRPNFQATSQDAPELFKK
jgi:LemA protein